MQVMMMMMMMVVVIVVVIVVVVGYASIEKIGVEVMVVVVKG